MAANDKQQPQQPGRASQPASPPDQSAEIAALKENVARLEQLLMAQISSQPKVTPDSLWAQEHQKQMAIREELDRQAALFQEDVQKRTQWEANKLNPSATRLWKVQVGWCPEIVLRAVDDVSAKAYYDRLCGIRNVSTNHNNPRSTEYTIVEVTKDPEAQKLVTSQWELKVAA